MERRYFRKSNPDENFINKVSGKFIPVDKIDNSIGVVSVGNPSVIEAILTAIAARRGGFSEITEAQYNEFIAQKKSDLKPRWREEVMKKPRSLKPSVAPVAVPVNAPELPVSSTMAPTSFRPTARGNG